MNPEFLAFSLVILLFSVIVHEVMHGYVALKFGDRTAENAGRLTLNPIPHIDPIGTILVPGLLMLSGTGILFGWAKPVPVNPLNFSDLRKGEFFVSAAGILANFALAIISAILYHLLNAMPTTPILVLNLLRYAVEINLLLGIFNLFPVPPLDGSKIVMSQLPYEPARKFEQLSQYGPIILLILIFTGVLIPIISIIVRVLSGILGVRI